MSSRLQILSCVLGAAVLLAIPTLRFSAENQKRIDEARLAGPPRKAPIPVASTQPKESWGTRIGKSLLKETPEHKRERIERQKAKLKLERLATAKALKDKQKEAQEALAAEKQRKQDEEKARKIAAKTFNGSFYLKGLRCESDEYSRWTEGEIVNISDTGYNFVSITILELDNEDNVVGSSIDNVGGLGPGQTWKFKALTLDERGTKVRVKDISGIPE